MLVEQTNSAAICSGAQLSFSRDDILGRTRLVKRKAGGLCHLSKPYWDGSFLTLQLVNPTAGMFEGDSLDLEVHLEAGAHVALECPSATRFYTMAEGAGAFLGQRFTLAADSCLEYSPEWTIPQRGAEVRIRTEIDLESGAELAFWDLMAPGRVAFGEQHGYQTLISQFELRQDGMVTVKEQMQLQGESQNRSGWPFSCAQWDSGFYGALWMVIPQANPTEFENILSSLERSSLVEGVVVGGSQLEESLFVIRVFAARSLLLKRELSRIRESFRGFSKAFERRSRRL